MVFCHTLTWISHRCTCVPLSWTPFLHQLLDPNSQQVIWRESDDTGTCRNVLQKNSGLEESESFILTIKSSLCSYSVIEGTIERLCRVLDSLGGLERQILESKSYQEVSLSLCMVLRSVLISFFYLELSSFPSTIYWRDCLCPIVYSCFLCQK